MKRRIPDIIWMEIMVTLALTRRKFDHVLEQTSLLSANAKSETVVWSIQC